MELQQINVDGVVHLVTMMRFCNGMESIADESSAQHTFSLAREWKMFLCQKDVAIVLLRYLWLEDTINCL
jgi:hypothetical protein